jgi:DNA-directed RNA polymerase III subunit RPC8
MKFFHDYEHCLQIVPDVGLGIKVLDILSISEGVIIPGDGGSYHRVKFRLIVFRPFYGEVIVGKIKASAPAGIQGSFYNYRVPFYFCFLLFLLIVVHEFEFIFIPS